MSATAAQLAALNRGTLIKMERARQRRALVGQPPAVVAAAIVNPPPELASYRLAALFGPKAGAGRRGMIPNFGAAKLRRALARLANDPGLGRQNWHAELRLDELTPREREHLALALIAAAPASWREAGAA